MYCLVNKSSFDKETGAVRGYVSDYWVQVKKARNLVGEIGNIWSGSDYDQFAMKMEGFLDDLEQTGISLDSYNDFLYHYASALEALDTDYLQRKISLK